VKRLRGRVPVPAEGEDFRCRLCAGASVATYRVREMMFGTRESFLYSECGECGCLQIVHPPSDLSGHYPPGYYSFQLGPGRFGGRLRDERNRYALLRRGWVGRLLAGASPYPIFEAHRWFKRSRISPESRILDVGCGSGMLLRDLARLGFLRVTGVDPHIAHDLELPGGGRVLRRTLGEVEGEFDLIMFHHSLEHISDQLGTFDAARRLLAPGGWIIVRVPTVSSQAWRYYREDWVQLDAPRHQVLHSVRSLEALGARVGLRLAAAECDSGGLQFIGSELYRNDVPLMEGLARVGRWEWRAANRRARALNRAGTGDQAVFYFTDG